jgi:hypothetical protein
MFPVTMCAIISVIYIITVGTSTKRAIDGQLDNDLMLICAVGWGFSCVLACLVIICGLLAFGG